MMLMRRVNIKLIVFFEKLLVILGPKERASQILPEFHIQRLKSRICINMCNIWQYGSILVTLSVNDSKDRIYTEKLNYFCLKASH